MVPFHARCHLFISQLGVHSQLVIWPGVVGAWLGARLPLPHQCAHTHVHMHKHTHTRTNTHTRTPTHTHTPASSRASGAPSRLAAACRPAPRAPRTSSWGARSGPHPRRHHLHVRTGVSALNYVHRCPCPCGTAVSASFLGQSERAAPPLLRGRGPAFTSLRAEHAPTLGAWMHVPTAPSMPTAPSRAKGLQTYTTLPVACTCRPLVGRGLPSQPCGVSFPCAHARGHTHLRCARGRAARRRGRPGAPAPA